MDETKLDETEKKLLAAQSVEEVAQILKEAGDDEAKAEKTWEEITRLRGQEGDNLSLDELEAVAGGFTWWVTKRNWYNDGCAATVEPDSHCWGTDGGCSVGNISYSRRPFDISCPHCGARYTAKAAVSLAFEEGGFATECYCRECQKSFFIDEQNRKLVPC